MSSGKRRVWWLTRLGLATTPFSTPIACTSGDVCGYLPVFAEGQNGRTWQGPGCHARDETRATLLHSCGQWERWRVLLLATARRPCAEASLRALARLAA